MAALDYKSYLLGLCACDRLPPSLVDSVCQTKFFYMIFDMIYNCNIEKQGILAPTPCTYRHHVV